MTDNAPEIEHRKPLRLSAIWILPILALGLGLWLILDSYLSQGPVVYLTLSDAEGIIAGETRVKRLSVDLGSVDDVYLNPGYSDVTVELNLDSASEDLLREDTQFWVVKPRIGTDGVSGLSTLLSGAYIELSPGNGAPGERSYEALDSPPATPVTTPGVRVELISTLDSTINARSPVYYNGFRVGQVETARLSSSDGNAHYELFINAPYDDLVTSNTRFWNASGLSLDAGVDGVSLRAESLETLLIGGIAFGLPEEIEPGTSIDNGHRFTLYPSYADIEAREFNFEQPYLLLFDTSIRGLTEGAPVEYRGARLGEVVDTSLSLLARDDRLSAEGQSLVPVLIHIQPGRIYPDTEQGLQRLVTLIEQGVPNGLRASLSTGNLLTGGLFIALDYHADAEPAEIRRVQDREILPTVNAGLVQIEQQISSILNRIEQLPLEHSLQEAATAFESLTTAMTSADQTLTRLGEILSNPATQSMPGNLETSLESLNEVLGGLSPGSSLYDDLGQSLEELRETLRNVRELSNSLNNQPNRLLLPSEAIPDLVPGRQ